MHSTGCQNLLSTLANWTNVMNRNPTLPLNNKLQSSLVILCFTQTLTDCIAALTVYSAKLWCLSSDGDNDLFCLAGNEFCGPKARREIDGAPGWSPMFLHRPGAPFHTSPKLLHHPVTADRLKDCSLQARFHCLCAARPFPFTPCKQS